MPLDLGKWDCLWEEGADDSGPLFTPSPSVPLSLICPLKRSIPTPMTCPHSTQKTPSSLAMSPPPTRSPTVRQTLPRPLPMSRGYEKQSTSAERLHSDLLLTKRTPSLILILFHSSILTENTSRTSSLTYPAQRSYATLRHHFQPATTISRSKTFITPTSLVSLPSNPMRFYLTPISGPTSMTYSGFPNAREKGRLTCVSPAVSAYGILIFSSGRRSTS